MENLKTCVEMAAKKMVMLSIETVDNPFLNSLSKVDYLKTQIHSPFLQAYPDVGNLTAWPENDVAHEIESNIDDIVAVHLKDAKPVTADFPGRFKEVPFGDGTVDFEAVLRLFNRLSCNGKLHRGNVDEQGRGPDRRSEEGQGLLRRTVRPRWHRAGADPAQGRLNNSSRNSI